jgi:hypothetical protein
MSQAQKTLRQFYSELEADPDRLREFQNDFGQYVANSGLSSVAQGAVLSCNVERIRDALKEESGEAGETTTVFCFMP